MSRPWERCMALGGGPPGEVDRQHAQLHAAPHLLLLRRLLELLRRRLHLLLLGRVHLGQL